MTETILVTVVSIGYLLLDANLYWIFSVRANFELFVNIVTFIFWLVNDSPIQKMVFGHTQGMNLFGKNIP